MERELSDKAIKRRIFENEEMKIVLRNKKGS